MYSALLSAKHFKKIKNGDNMIKNMDELISRYTNDEIIDIWNHFCIEFDENYIEYDIDDIVDFLCDCDCRSVLSNLILNQEPINHYTSYYQLDNSYEYINTTNDLKDFDLDMLIDYINDNEKEFKEFIEA